MYASTLSSIIYTCSGTVVLLTFDPQDESSSVVHGDGVPACDGHTGGAGGEADDVAGPAGVPGPLGSRFRQVCVL